jgi:hypothetical protein
MRAQVYEARNTDFAECVRCGFRVLRAEDEGEGQTEACCGSCGKRNVISRDGAVIVTRRE